MRGSNTQGVLLDEGPVHCRGRARARGRPNRDSGVADLSTVEGAAGVGGETNPHTRETGAPGVLGDRTRSEAGPSSEPTNPLAEGEGALGSARRSSSDAWGSGLSDLFEEGEGEGEEEDAPSDRESHQYTTDEESLDWDFGDLRRRSSAHTARGLAHWQMAGARIKFQPPPKFAGTGGEDAVGWLHRYERIGRYNKWDDEDLLGNLEMSLEGAALKWFTCLDAAGLVPARWEDQAGAGAGPRVRGLKSVFLAQFTPADYARFNEDRLRSRKQGGEEPTTEYYYDILDLCRRVNPTMGERAKIQHLFRGLRPNILEKMWTLKPTTCEDFLAEVKRYQELMEPMKSQGGLPLGALTQGKEPQPKDEIANKLEKMEKMVAGMQEALGKLATQQGGGREKKSWGNAGQRPGRTADGKIICWNCGSAGHPKRICPAPKKEATGGKQADGRPGSRSTSPAPGAQPVGMMQAECSKGGTTWPCLKIDTSRLVVREVLCEGKKVNAVIDTGAAVSVISPELVEALKLHTDSVDNAARIVTVDGQTIRTQGSVIIGVSDGESCVKGCARVLQMGGIDLLLGTDFLAGLRTRIKIGASPEFVIEDIPLGSFAPPEQKEESKKLVTAVGRRVPARSIVCVEVEPTPLAPEVDTILIEPSTKLLETRGLSTGRAVVNVTGPLHGVLVANLTGQPTWVEAGTVLGETVEPEAVGSPPNGAMEEDGEPEELDFGSQISDELEEDQRYAVKKVLEKFRACFAGPGEKLGACTVTTHRIDTGDARPIHQHPFAKAWKEREMVQEQVEEMLAAGVIEKSTSPWGSPVVMVKKKDGTWRFCVDYRKLNGVTVKDVYPLPRVEETLARLQGAAFFSIMDLQSGYWQVPIQEEDKPKTAFVTADGLYQFKVMPFGLCAAPSTFQRMMDVVLSGLRWSSCLVYLDDIIIYSATFEEHLERLKGVLSCLRDANLKVKLKKCCFAHGQLKALGHVVDKEGIAPDPEKVRAITDFPRPPETGREAEKVRQVRSFIGICSYYRRFVPNFSGLARPLFDLLKKGNPFVWGPEQEESYATLKNALIGATRLAHPDFSREFEIHPDACDYGIGAALVQRGENGERPIAFASRLLSAAERNYSITEKEGLALVWALQKFHSYIWGTAVTVVTDHHALCWLTTKKDLAGKLARWALTVQGYAPTIKYKSGRLHEDADALSRNPVGAAEENEDEEEMFPVWLTTEQPDLQASIRTEQEKEPGWGKIIKDLEEGTGRRGNFVLVDGLLHLRTLVGQRMIKKLCVPREQRVAIIQACHDDMMAGHLGRRRTCHKIEQRYFWPGLRKQVIGYIQSCRLCQTRKAEPRSPGGYMEICHVGQPFEKVGIDVLGPFPTSGGGMKNIIVAVDYLTKWAETRALPSATAKDAADFFVRDIVLRHGTPENVVTDCGKCFMSAFMQEVMKIMGAQHRSTTPYHPQSNGLVERLNHTLADMISMYVNSAHSDWDEILPYVTFAYNTSRQESTGRTPFFLLYGREAKLPIDYALRSDPNPAGEQSAEETTRLLNKARGEVAKRLVDVQAKQKEAYDKGHREAPVFEVGEEVLIYKPVRKVKRSEKLLHKFLGPYVVVRRLTQLNYEVKLPRGRKTEVVHVGRMKKFFLPTEEAVVAGEQGRRQTGDTTPPAESRRGHPTLRDKNGENSHAARESRPHQQVEPRKEGGGTEEGALSDSFAPSPGREATSTSARPQRQRKPPVRFSDMVMFFLLCLLLPCFAAPPKTVVNEGVVFGYQGEVRFTDSEWIVVTDVSLHHLEATLGGLRAWLAEKTKLPVDPTAREEVEKWKRGGGATRIQEKAKGFQEELEIVWKRFETLKTAMTGRPGRQKRGLVNLGGETLKWLFGVATDKDLGELDRRLSDLSRETTGVVHALSEQASLVNETLWELQEHATAISQLGRNQEILEKELNRWKQALTNNLADLERQMALNLRIDDAFDSARRVLGWAQQTLDDLGVGLALLAAGKLPPEVFPPHQLKKILKEIQAALPQGWTLSPLLDEGNLWRAYQEAQVVTAAHSQGLRLFVHFPVFEVEHAFQLYRVASLPVSNTAGTLGVSHTPLPSFLAVAHDQQTFLELSEGEIGQCRDWPNPVCPISRAIARKSARKACAMALFLDDAVKKKGECEQHFLDWKGPEAIYLGSRRWAFSSSKPQPLVLTCVGEKGKIGRRTINLPTVGQVEIPRGCTAQTDDWVLQASFTREMDSKVGDVGPTPSLRSVDLSFSRESAPLQGKDRNHTLQSAFASLLTRNRAALTASELAGRTLRQLESEEARRTASPETVTHSTLYWLGGSLAALTVGALALGLSQRWRYSGYASMQTRLESLEQALINETAARQQLLGDVGRLAERIRAHEAVCADP